MKEYLLFMQLFVGLVSPRQPRHVRPWSVHTAQFEIR